MPAPRRQGPRPLPLHWNIYLLSLLSCGPGLMLSQLPLSLSPLSPELKNLAHQLNQLPASQLGPALAKVSASKLQLFISGVERYCAHPYHRTLKEPPVLWQQGSTRLLDYGKKGQPVLFIPSLINAATILDLDKNRSLLRWLAGQGLRPLLLDWGQPSAAETNYTLDDYTARAASALASLGQPAHVVGYCMGGLIALKVAQVHKNKVERLALLATPWDFHAGHKEAALRAAALYRVWQPGLSQLPVDYIQTLFTLLDPLGPGQKFIRFAELPEGPEAQAFVVLEDWLNEGVALTKPVADTCLIDWYERNAAHEFVDPARVQTPTLVMLPQHDKIVPPESAEALAQLLPDCRRIKVPLGHIGMIISHNAPAQSWAPLAAFLTPG
jgi:polyhydroxyalkanoate synthase